MTCYVCWTLFILSGVGLATLFSYYINPSDDMIMVHGGDYWRPERIPKGPGGKPPKENDAIEKFTIEFDTNMLAELHGELTRTKWYEPLEDAAYHYGVNLKTFKDFIEYWRTKFDFKKAQERINQFPHYRTEIEGLRIHFFRSLPETGKDIKVIPLLMIHGWPGSFVEFLKVAPRLSKAVNGVAFDVIVPSLPGFGYSDASTKQGMDILNTARIFKTLMERLGYSKYYIQGGDWGSAVTTAMALFYRENIRGIHLNMVFVDSTSVKSVVRQALFSMFPNYFGDGHLPKCMMVPFFERFVDLLRESGYMHIQSTKPDTVGFGLLNSPAGLAAYISEKFSTWTQADYRYLDDGGHGKKISVDDILTNIMVYYATGSIISSQRYYRENFASGVTQLLAKFPIYAPMGYAVFPNEIACVPQFIASTSYVNITTMTYQKDGGHFAAFEQPILLEKDVRLFVDEVEKLYPENVAAPVGFAANLVKDK